MEEKTDGENATIKKKKRGGNRKKTIRPEQKQLIVDGFFYLLSQKSKRAMKLRRRHCNSEAVTELSRMHGIDKATVYRIIRNMDKPEEPKPKMCPPIRKRKTKLMERIDPYDREQYRHIVHDFYASGVFPSADDVRKVAEMDPRMRRLTRVPITKLLKEFSIPVIQRTKDNMFPKERGYYAKWRLHYIETIRKYREEGKIIYYVGETSISTADGTKEGKTTRLVNLEASSDQSDPSDGEFDPEDVENSPKPNRARAAKKPPKEKHVRVFHIGSEYGFVDEGLAMFDPKKMTDDCPRRWFCKAVDSLEPGSIIVVKDTFCKLKNPLEVPYHKNITSAELIRWLKRKDISFRKNMKRVELQRIIAEYVARHDDYSIDEVAKNDDHIILRLPPMHDDLNAMGLAMEHVKSFVRERNNSFRLWDIRRLIPPAVRSVTQKKWKEIIAETIKRENEIWTEALTGQQPVEASGEQPAKKGSESTKKAMKNIYTSSEEESSEEEEDEIDYGSSEISDEDIKDEMEPMDIEDLLSDEDLDEKLNRKSSEKSKKANGGDSIDLKDEPTSDSAED
uniref:Uncharacterized protein n=1 Tax=Lutzomyia longipalpis TaxID=7200 RepID=A0A1B0CCU0_LUTLO